MTFEMMLAQLMNLPVKFLLGEPIEIKNKYKDRWEDPEAQKEMA